MFTMFADGTGIEQLTGGEGQGHNWCPSWSPDGTRICFVSTRDDYARLRMMNSDGSGEERLTAIQDADDDAPDWSPDGARIVFGRGNRKGADDLYLLDLQSRTEEELTRQGLLDSSPSWSSDGELIAFRRSYGYPPGVYVISAEGGEAWFLTPGYHPSWSPLGDKVAYSHAGGIWVIAADAEGQPSGEPTQLTTNGQGHDRHPTWSPDGGYLAFESEVLREQEYERRIVTMNAEGADVKDLGEGHNPDWSPPSD